MRLFSYPITKISRYFLHTAHPFWGPVGTIVLYLPGTKRAYTTAGTMPPLESEWADRVWLLDPPTEEEHYTFWSIYFAAGKTDDKSSLD